MDLKKKHFEIPTLTTYGTLIKLTEAHSEKIKTHGNAWAWGHYKDGTVTTRATIPSQFRWLLDLAHNKALRHLRGLCFSYLKIGSQRDYVVNTSWTIWITGS
jgi:hypothetical protein